MPAKVWPIKIRLDDLTGQATQTLIRRHLAGMHDTSPPESVHAFDVDKLRDPAVTFWSAWIGDNIAGCGALKSLDASHGEIKSMRVVDAFLGQGVGRAVLSHIMLEATIRGLKRLSLETGSGAAFEPALKLYQSVGFETCPPFGAYVLDPFSVFMTREI
jgi:putative acetyltransferase